MADRMTKSEIYAYLADKTGLKRKEVQSVLEELAQLAYKEAKNTFVVPDLGIIVLNERAARKMMMRFGPKAGQEILVPAKKVLRFRFSKAAKDAILGVSPKAKATGAKQVDDFVIIEGIGPKIAKALNKAGITTFAQLSKMTAPELDKILRENKYLGETNSWPEQARLAAEGKMDELKALQDRLVAGREK